MKFDEDVKRGMNKEWYSNWEYDDVIVCPYCSKIYEPTYEETFIGGKEVDCYKEGERGEFICDKCGKKFRLSADIVWVYTTESIKGEMTEEEWEQIYG